MKTKHLLSNLHFCVNSNYNITKILKPRYFRVYSEEQPGDAATALFIKKLSEEDAGNYRCTAIYASNQELEARVEISVFSKNSSLFNAHRVI